MNFKEVQYSTRKQFSQNCIAFALASLSPFLGDHVPFLASAACEASFAPVLLPVLYKEHTHLGSLEIDLCLRNFEGQ